MISIKFQANLISFNQLDRANSNWATGSAPGGAKKSSSNQISPNWEFFWKIGLGQIEGLI